MHSDVTDHDGGFGGSDADLMIAVASENADALAEVYDRYGEVVYGLVFRFCGQQQAETVTHEVFLALWRSPESFALSRGSLRMPLLVRACRQAVAVLRADACEPGSQGSASTHPPGQVPALPEEQDAAELLADLPFDERCALYLALCCGLDYHQLAVLVQHSADAVATDLRSGLRRLANRS